MAKKFVNKKRNQTHVRPEVKEVKEEIKVLIYKNGMTVADLAAALGRTTAEIIKKLMANNLMVTQNAVLDRDIIELIAIEYDLEIQDAVITDLMQFDEMIIEDKEENLVSRPPVVTIMGHVDHGKTTLLDYIRHSKVVASEAGGITQHIGAYQVHYNNNLITFIDTPGHAAFTEMRARGAQVTDIIVLVVAADDGVMPQTEEAIQHATAAGCPIIVAVNKVDKPHANPDRVMEELSHFNLIPEAWGGKTPFINISALKGMGIDDLLEMIQFTAEVADFKANPKREAIGTVIEAQLDKGLGPIATLLVQNGTLKNGDFLICGDTYGKIRSMVDETNARLNEACPSKAVVITGLADVPFAGDKFIVVDDEKKARQIAERRAYRTKNADMGPKIKSLDEMFDELKETKELNLVIKADVQGSLEAVKNTVSKLNVEDINVNIIRSGVGGITETDVTLAAASSAIIIGFNVRPTAVVRNIAQDKGIEIRLYNIIYKIVDDITAALKGMLDPEFEEVVTGQAEVRNIFKVSKIGTIAGCFVTDGVIERNSLIRVIREGIVVYEGKMASLKRFKDDVKEVKNGYECGITIHNFNDVKEGDILEASIMKEVKK